MWPAVRAHCSQAGHGGGSEPPPRLARFQVQLSSRFRPSSRLGPPSRFRQPSYSGHPPYPSLRYAHHPPNASPGWIFPSARPAGRRAS